MAASITEVSFEISQCALHDTCNHLTSMTNPIDPICEHIMRVLTPNPTEQGSEVLADSVSIRQHIAGLKNHFMSMFSRRVTVKLDLKDLLLEQVLLDLMSKEIASQSFRPDDHAELPWLWILMTVTLSWSGS